MAVVFAMLDGALRSKSNKEGITSLEMRTLDLCKERARGAFTSGILFSMPITWAVTGSLNFGKRISLLVGCAMVSGMWRASRSMDEAINDIVGTEGTRLQRECASIILRTHQQNSSMVQLVRKHFFLEEVFSDLDPDKPFFRWTLRSFLAQDAAAQNIEGAGESNHPENPYEIQPKQLTRIPDGEMIADPLECILGHQVTDQETNHSDRASLSRKRHLRASKRAHRHRRAQSVEIPNANLEAF